MRKGDQRKTLNRDIGDSFKTLRAGHIIMHNANTRTQWALGLTEERIQGWTHGGVSHKQAKVKESALKSKVRVGSSTK
jgi:hypothetical protein